MIDFQTPLSGMQRAAAGVERAGARIAAATTGRGDAVDLTAQMIALMTGRSGFEANVKVAQTEDQMSRSLLNLLG